MDSNLHRFYWNGADFFIIELKIDENELTVPYKYFYMKKSGSQSKKTKKGKSSFQIELNFCPFLLAYNLKKFNFYISTFF